MLRKTTSRIISPFCWPFSGPQLDNVAAGLEARSFLWGTGVGDHINVPLALLRSILAFGSSGRAQMLPRINCAGYDWGLGRPMR